MDMRGSEDAFICLVNSKNKKENKLGIELSLKLYHTMTPMGKGCGASRVESYREYSIESTSLFTL